MIPYLLHDLRQPHTFTSFPFLLFLLLWVDADAIPSVDVEEDASEWVETEDDIEQGLEPIPMPLTTAGAGWILLSGKGPPSPSSLCLCEKMEVRSRPRM